MTANRRAIATARSLGQLTITSHRSVSTAIADIGVDLVFTSPSRRAAHTAELVAPEGMRTVTDPLLVERGYGVLEGRTRSDALALEPPILFIDVGGERHSVNPPDAEPFEDVWAHAKQFAARVLSSGASSDVLVVSHSTFLQMLSGVFRGLSCIESLSIGCATLELMSFDVEADRLDGWHARPLITSKGGDF